MSSTLGKPLRSAPRRTMHDIQYPSNVRVLWVSTSFFPNLGGVELYVEKTVESLSGICDAGLVTKRHHWIPACMPVAHFTLDAPPSSNLDATWPAIVRQLRTIITRFSPDLVHFSSARSAIYRRAVREGIPTVATVHGNDLTDARPAPGGDDPTAFIVQSLNACDWIFPVSRHTAALCREWGVTSPITVLTPGCDIDFFTPWPELGEEARAFYGIAPETPVLLTASRLVSRKGHFNVLSALSQLPFAAHWLVVGDGPCQAGLIAAAKALEMEDQVSLVGTVSDDDLLALYNACDVFVLTPEQHSLNGWLDSEGFGLVLHEAGACAKPVITSDDAGCREAVIDGGTGILVPPGDPGALAQALESLLTDREVAQSLGRAASKFVRACGGWRRLGRQLISEYECVLK